MSPQSLQTVILCALLAVIGHAAASCMNATQLQLRGENFVRRMPIKNYTDSNQLASSTCELAAREARGPEENDRALSPWRYRINRDADRFPSEISEAECLCRGCIINQKENTDYNSVLIYAPLRVLKKTQCSTDSDKYVVIKEWITVAVGCTCVRPVVQESR